MKLETHPYFLLVLAFLAMIGGVYPLALFFVSLAIIAP